MDLLPEFFPQVTQSEWDEANSDKNWRRHRVSQAEAEQVILNRPVLVADDPKHSHAETRYFALGRTNAGRELAVVFTLRASSLRVISARSMSRHERTLYAKAKEA